MKKKVRKNSKVEKIKVPICSAATVHAGLDKELADWIDGLSLEQIKVRAELLAVWTNQLNEHFLLTTIAGNRINFWN